MNQGPIVTAHAIDRYLERVRWLPSRKHVRDKIIDGYFDGFRAPWSLGNERWNARNAQNYRSHTESGSDYYLTPSMVLIVNRGQVRTVLAATTEDVATALTYLLTGQWIDDGEEELGMVVANDPDMGDEEEAA